MADGEGVAFGPFRLDGDGLWRGTEAVTLAPRPLAVLACLAAQPGRVLGKDQLLDAVWGHRHVSEGVLKSRIAELRKALGDDPQTPRYIETVARRGYRFLAEVRELAPAEPAAPAAALPAPPLPTGVARVGRDEPLQRLEQHWRAACAGQRQLVFLSGEAGLGKTTLIEMFLQRLAPEAPAVLWGQCLDHYGAGEAFLPWLDALGRAGRAPRVQAALRAKAPAWLIQLPGLLSPEQRQALQPEVLGATRERMLREGGELFEALSTEIPLTLILEDLHWSDYASLDLLAALGRSREPAKLLVLGSYRPSDLALHGHPLQSVRQELQVHGLCTELPLDAFSPEELKAYLAQRFPDNPFPDDLAVHLHRRSGGHPLFLAHLLDALLADGRLKPAGGWWRIDGGPEDLTRGIPDTVQALIEHQTRKLPAEEQRLLETLSAAGRDASAALLAAALGQDSLAVETACDALARRGPMLEAVGIAEWPDGAVAGHYAFRHALYGEVLYQRLPPARRIDLHRRLGERLEAAYRGQTAAIAAELARHFEAGRDWPKAVCYLIEAAQHSAGRFANREALGYLGRALELVERLPVETQVDSRLALWRQRALIFRSLADWPGMAADLDAVVALAGAEQRPENEVEALILNSLAGFHADRVQGLAYAERAVACSRGVADDRLQVYAEANRALLYRNPLEQWRPDNLSCITEGVRRARDSGDRVFLSLFSLGESLVYLDQADYTSLLTVATEVARLSLAMGDGYQFGAAQKMAVWALLGLGRWGEAWQGMAETRRTSERNNTPLGLALTHLTEAMLRLEALDFQGALGCCEQSRAHPAELFVFPLFQALRGQACLGLGHCGEASRQFGELVAALDAGALVELRNQAILRRGLAECRLAQRDFEQARLEAQRLLAIAAPSQNRADLAHGHRLLAQIALAERDWSTAEAHVGQALAVIEGAAVPLAAWRVHETAAELHGCLGRAAEARSFTERAAALLQALADSLGDDPEGQRLRRSLLGHPLCRSTVLTGQEGRGR